MDLDLDLKKAGRAVKKFWPVVLAVFILAFAVVFTKTKCEWPVFSANASFLVAADIQKTDNSVSVLNEQAAGTCASLCRSNTVLAEAAARAGSKLGPSQILAMMQIRQTVGSDLIGLTVSSRDGKAAADIANAVVETLLSRHIRLNPSVPVLITPVDKAVYSPENTPFLTAFKTGMLGGFAGVTLTVLIIFLAAALSSRIHTPCELEKTTGLAFLGAVSRSGAGAAEAGTLLRGALSGKAAAVVSPCENNAAEALAASFIASGYKTLLFKRGENLPGAPAGLDSAAAFPALDALKKDGDYILIDSDKPAAAALARNAVLAVPYGKTKLSEAVSLCKKLSLTGALTVGFVIFNVPDKDMSLFA